MQFRQGEGGAVAEIGQRVPVAAGNLPDQAFPSQLPQFIPDAGRCRVLRRSPHLLDEDRAELRVGEGLETEPGAPECRQDPHRPRRADPESGDALPSVGGGSDKPLQGGAAQGGGQRHRLRFLEARDRASVNRSYEWAKTLWLHASLLEDLAVHGR